MPRKKLSSLSRLLAHPLFLPFNAVRGDCFRTTDRGSYFASYRRYSARILYIQLLSKRDEARRHSFARDTVPDKFRTFNSAPVKYSCRKGRCHTANGKLSGICYLSCRQDERRRILTNCCNDGLPRNINSTACR